MMRTRYCILLAACGCVLCTVVWTTGISSYGQTPIATTQGSQPSNADLLKQPQYTSTLKSLDSLMRFRPLETYRWPAYREQCNVDAKLFLEAMRTSPQIRPPYLYCVAVTSRMDKPRPFEFIELHWLGTDDVFTIPKFEVIGREGKVVGSFDGVAKPQLPLGDNDSWFRVLHIKPIYRNGEKKDQLVLGNEIDLRLDISNLREIEGIRFIPDDKSLPRFVPAFFDDTFFGGGTPSTAPATQMQLPPGLSLPGSRPSWVDQGDAINATSMPAKK